MKNDMITRVVCKAGERIAARDLFASLVKLYSGSRQKAAGSIGGAVRGKYISLDRKSGQYVCKRDAVFDV